MLHVYLGFSTFYHKDQTPKNHSSDGSFTEHSHPKKGPAMLCPPPQDLSLAHIFT